MSAGGTDGMRRPSDEGPPSGGRRGYRARVVVEVDTAGLLQVLGRPPLGEYLRRLWQRRHFIVADSRARVESDSRANLLGSLWLVLNPLLSGAVYFVIFGLVMRGSRGIENFLGYLIIGVFLFQYTIQCLTQGSRSISAGRALIRAFNFPRAALPIAVVLRETLRFVPALVTMLVLIVVIPWLMPLIDPSGDEIVLRLTWLWLLLPAVLVLQVLLGTGLALIAARMTARIPDLTQVIGIFARFWLYGSAVFFSIERFAEYPKLSVLMQVNPMFLVIDIARDLLLYATMPSGGTWALLTAWSVGLLVLGTLYFWQAEETYAAP